MCMITTALIGGIMKTVGEQRQYAEQEAEAEYYAAQEAENARLARREAEAIGIMNMQEEQQLNRKMLAQRSSARAGYAAQGVVLGGGVTADYEADIADAYSMDMANLRYDTESQQWQKRVAATNHDNQNAMYRYKIGDIRAARKTSLLSGIFDTSLGVAKGAGRYITIFGGLGG